MSFFQALEAEVSRLGSVLRVDLEKAKQLLSSAVEDQIPMQIQQDLESTYLQLESEFTAVSQLCAKRNSSLIQVMETEKVCVKIVNQIKNKIKQQLN